jgi:phospholipid transport system substrate-binding protein
MSNIVNTVRVRFIIALLFFLSATELAAQTAAPAVVAKGSTQTQSGDASEVIRVAIEDVLSTMRENEALYGKNPQKLQTIIEKTALPYLSIQHMAKLALGKNWKSATPQQQATIVREFQIYLMRSYVRTLYSYRYVKPEILSREDSGANKTVLKVSVKNERGSIVSLLLRLEKNENRWQILDINAEGISLVVTARGLFNDEISKKGLDGFIQSLIDQNKKASLNDSQ